MNWDRQHPVSANSRQDVGDPNWQRLARHAPGRIAFHQLLDFRDADEIYVAENRMFQAGSRYREVQGFLVVTGVGEQTVNKASHKRIASTYTIYDMGDVIPAGFVQPVVGV